MQSSGDENMAGKGLEMMTGRMCDGGYEMRGYEQFGKKNLVGRMAKRICSTFIIPLFDRAGIWRIL